MGYQTVYLDIEVPTGFYCWEYNGSPCQHFDNEGGWNRCELSLGELSAKDKRGIVKPDRCLNLPTADKIEIVR